MVRPKRSEQIVDLRIEIKEMAWKQIAERGASALSLRSIARSLGIAAPSIYNYYPTRDDLVTALILDAFASLEECLRDTASMHVSADYSQQLAALGLAYRQWAISQPQRYQLVFGTPIPGYAAPEERTLPSASAAFVPLITLLQAAFVAGSLMVKRLVPLTPPLKIMLEMWQGAVGGVDIEVLYMALVFWSRVHGLMMFEINGQYPAFITDPAEVYAREINQINQLYFKGKQYVP